MVFVTTPPQPESNARRMLLSDSVGGADESMNGFSKWIPVKFTEVSTAIASSSWSYSRHPVRAVLAIPFRRHLLGTRPELNRSATRDVANTKPRFIPPTERERLPRHR